MHVRDQCRIVGELMDKSTGFIEYMDQIKNKISLEEINNILELLKDKSVLVIGDTIIDTYVFVHPKGRAIKDPILSTEFERHEDYAGGILAIANHISTFVKKIKVVTLLGERGTQLDFVNNSLGSNVELKAFIKKGAHTIVKKRYVDAYRNSKLFKVEYINDDPISDSLSSEVISYLEEEIPKYDLVVVGDFGHGFINQGMRKAFAEKSSFLCINSQSNSSNMGYNYISQYENANFITLDEQELRLPVMMRFETIDEVMPVFQKKFGYEKFLVTLGKNGSAFYNNGNVKKAPILLSSVLDTVGSGDAVFALSSLFFYAGANDHLLPFIANCAGGIKATYHGNKESVTKEKLTEFVSNVLKDERGCQ
jgi:bifunctional ADP-heptose synthase (sugar kinase/adenylyltransferase)